MMDLEICGETFEAAKAGAEFGFKRIELCANLNEGGTTPSFGMIQKCASLKTIEVHAMIRPRGGSFVYSEDEKDIMARDIVTASIAGAKGVVFGCLKEDNTLDLPATLLFAEIAIRQKMEFTFHRAIDSTPDPLETLRHLVKMGFTRVLTSGGKNTAAEGIEGLTKMAAYGGENNLQIMAGGGVNKTNAVLLKSAGVHALHFTAHKIKSNPLPAGMGQDLEVDQDKVRGVLEVLRK